MRVVLLAARDVMRQVRITQFASALPFHPLKQREHALSLFALLQILRRQQSLPQARRYSGDARCLRVRLPEQAVEARDPAADIPGGMRANFVMCVHGVGLSHKPGPSGGKAITASAITMHRPLLAGCNRNRAHEHQGTR